MDDQWSVLQSEKHDGALLNSSPHVPSRFGPQARAKPAWGSAFSMSETGRKCFQLSSQQSTPSQIALGLRNSAALGLAEANHVRLLMVSQFGGHRLCAHRRNVELRLDIDLVSVGDRINVLIIVLQMGCWELGD